MIMNVEKPEFGVAHPTVIPGDYQSSKLIDTDSDASKDTDNHTSGLETSTQ
jgi:hypothetical protein